MTPAVFISDPAGFNTQRVPVNGAPARSWVVDGAGSLSAECVSPDLVRLGLNDELRGHRIVCLDDDAGTWSGVITDVQPNGDGTTEIAAEDNRFLFSGTRIPRKQRPLHGWPGSVALTLIAESTRRHGTVVQERYADDIGLPVTMNLDGSDLRDALDRMASESAREWWIDPDALILYWGVKGTDKTGTVQLIESRHITDWRAPTSIAPVINDLEGYPLNDRASIRQSVVVEDAASIAAVGRRQGSIGIAGGPYASHIRSAALGLVEQTAQLGHAIELSVVNVDGCFGRFREGDTICVLLPSVSHQLTVRIMARALDDSGVMSVSGIVTGRRVAA
jgi:hypothetical protein